MGTRLQIFVWSRSQTEFLQKNLVLVRTYIFSGGVGHNIDRCIRLTFSMAKLPDLPGEPHQPVLFSFPKRTFGQKIALKSFQSKKQGRSEFVVYN